MRNTFMKYDKYEKLWPWMRNTFYEIWEIWEIVTMDEKYFYARPVSIGVGERPERLQSHQTPPASLKDSLMFFLGKTWEPWEPEQLSVLHRQQSPEVWRSEEFGETIKMRLRPPLPSSSSCSSSWPSPRWSLISIKITFALASLAASASAAIALWSCTGSRQSLLVQTPNSYHRRFMFRAQHDVLGLLHLFWEWKKNFSELVSEKFGTETGPSRISKWNGMNDMKETIETMGPIWVYKLFSCARLYSAAEEDYDKYEKELGMKYCWAETLRNAA